MPNSTRRARISARARRTAIEIHADGQSVYAIIRHLNSTRMKPPGGGVWTRQTVLGVLKAANLYAPHPAAATSPEAVDVIVKMAGAGAGDTEIIAALNASGLKPAGGGAWRSGTVYRIRAKHGLISTPRRSDQERFDERVTHAQNDCALWTGRVHGDGYAHLEIDGRNVLAHKWAWEREHGPVPDGHNLHHVCKTPLCVNTGHLIPVPVTSHRALERSSDAVEEAFRSGQLRIEAQASAAGDWLAEHGNRRLGSLLADEVTA